MPKFQPNWLLRLNPRWRRIALFGAGFILLLGVVVVSWAYQTDLDRQLVQGRKAQTKEQEVQSTIARVATLMTLPSDEEPVIATILDAETLAAEQPFYQGVQNGDKLLVYPKAGKAILYAVESHKILNAGPVYFQGGELSPTTTNPAAQMKVSVEIRNGGTTTGLANATRDQLMKEDVNQVLSVLKTGNAVRSDYSETLVVDLSNGIVSSQALQAIAQRLNAKTTNVLPIGEASSSAQVVIILGKGSR